MKFGDGETENVKESYERFWNNHLRFVESQHIIGQQELEKAEWIVRAPSEIYWAALRTFGISSISSSVTKWLEYVEGQLAPETGSRPKHSRQEEYGVTDDEDTHLVDWKVDINIDEDIFQNFAKTYDAKALRPELTQREAAFLRDRICRFTPGSLLELFLVQGREPPDPNLRSDDDKVSKEEKTSFYRFAMSLKSSELSGEMKRLLSDACAFNRLNFAANVLYNRMLGIPEAETTWNAIRDTVPDLRVDLSSVCELSKSSRMPSAVKFLNDIQGAFRSGDIKTAKN